MLPIYLNVTNTNYYCVDTCTIVHVHVHELFLLQVIPLDTGTQTWKLYKRRFAVHFKMNIDKSGYVPTIMCYDTRSKSLEVHCICHSFVYAPDV